MVRLYEYQSKRLLKSVGIPVPEGDVASTPEEAKKIAEQIGKPIAVKAQVWVTGRFKAGGIRFADNYEEVEKIAGEILGAEIKGFKTQKVLVEEKLNVDKEYYLGIIVDDSYKVRAPVVLLSTEGGVDIEEVAEKHREKISRIVVDYLHGLQLSGGRKLVSKLEESTDLIDRLSDIACKLYTMFERWDINTVEINPLILTKDRRIFAADCRITLDDNSVFRHPEFKIELPRDMARPPTELERIAWKIEESDYRGICYFIQLNPDIEEIRKGGYIAFHGIGGGASMLAADALMQRGLKLATYADTSGNPTASKVYRGIKVLLSIPGIEGYFLAGAVLANQEQWYHAYALVKALREEARERPGFPVLILIAGNKEGETHRIIKEGIRDLPLRWELYGRDHIYDLDFLAKRMIALIEEYRKERGSYVGNVGRVFGTLAENPLGKHLSFESQTGKIDIHLSKCIAPTCGFACVKGDRWYGRPCLKIEDGKPALAGIPEELRRLCNECLSCEIECELHGGKCIKIELPLYGLEEFKRKHSVPVER